MYRFEQQEIKLALCNIIPLTTFKGGILDTALKKILSFKDTHKSIAFPNQSLFWTC